VKDDEQKIKPLPLLIGPRNAEAVTGFTYRWVRDTAAALGVPFVAFGRKRAVRADLFLAALERSPSRTGLPLEDPAATVRANLGLRLISLPGATEP
jgi:hypothetical protein